MTVHSLKELEKFIKKHRDAKDELESWLALIKLAEWDNFDALKLYFPKKDFAVHALNNPGWILFKFGHRWRIDVYIKYEVKIVIINRVGTHEEYNKWKPKFH